MKAPRWYWAFVMANAAMGAASPLLPLYAYFLGGNAADVGALAAVGSLFSSEDEHEGVSRQGTVARGAKERKSLAFSC